MKLIACNEIPRSKIYQYLGMAKNQLKIAEDDYRELLARHGAKADSTGRISAKTMTAQGLEAALHELQKKGFAPIAKKQKTQWRQPRIKKLNAMWIALHDAGVVHNRSEEAMEAFCKNHVPGLKQMNWATSEQLNQAVEMVKQFAKRNNVKVF